LLAHGAFGKDPHVVSATYPVKPCEGLLNIAVTGGAVYVDSDACKALAAKGYVPITYDNLARSNFWAVNWGSLEKGDVANVFQIHGVLEKYRPSEAVRRAVIAVAEMVCGRGIRSEIVERRPADPPILIADGRCSSARTCASAISLT
jgi:UDP-glucose 4-epimerase